LLTWDINDKIPLLLKKASVGLFSPAANPSNMQTSSRKPWNKDRCVGPRERLTPEQIQLITQHFINTQNTHDLCLFTVAIDTMLRASDLLGLKVSDVMRADGRIRDRFVLRQKKTRQPVKPTLTPASRKRLANWIAEDGKSSGDFIFTRHKGAKQQPITVGFYRSLIKAWCEAVGIDPHSVSAHSLRRSKAIHLYESGASVELIGRLLGHRNSASTIHYLGINDAKAQDAALKHTLF
jgi:integrase